MSAVHIGRAIWYGALIWVAAFLWAIVIMMIIGVDFSKPDASFGPDHPLYWRFELLMLPSFLLFALFLFRRYFRRSAVASELWRREALLFGLIVMAVQFFLDTIVLVFLMGNGFEYFAALVTVTYLTIPAWAYLAGWLWKGRALARRNPSP